MSDPNPNPTSSEAPTFDAIFSSQQLPPRRSSTSSSFNAYSFQSPYPHMIAESSHSHSHSQSQSQSHNHVQGQGQGQNQNQNQLGQGQGQGQNQYYEEPQSINRKSSNSSLNGNGFSNGNGLQAHSRNRQSSSSSSSTGSTSDMMSKGYNNFGSLRRRQSSLRKESLPFNPESDSTIIATAPRQGNRFSSPSQGYSSPPIGDIMFGGQARIQDNSQIQIQPNSQNQIQNQNQNQTYQYQANDQLQQQWAGVGTIGILQQQQQQQQQPITQYAQAQIPRQQQQQEQQYSPFPSPVPTPSSAGLNFMTPGSANSINDSTMYDQFSPYTNQAITPNQQNHAGWGQEFVGQAEPSQGYSSGYIGADTNDGQMNGIDDLMGISEQDALNNELQRIISNTSHHSSAQQSGDQSPFPQHAQTPNPDYNQLYQNQVQGHSRHGSFSASRSPSPFAPPQQQQQYDMSDLTSPPVSGTFQVTGGSAPGSSPFFNKPQSPPALIIPNQHSPSPKLPPIITTTSSGPSGIGQKGMNAPRQGDLGGSVSGGLLPPVNPALEHLTGMAGISPIAPSADGPMIYIQPSTPISGMKDGRGLFDAALRRAGQMAQQGGQQNQGDFNQQQGFNVPPPQSHPLVRPGSSDQLAQSGQSNTGGLNDDMQGGMDFATAMAFQATQGWGQLGGASLGAGIQTRPRAKSDSFMPSPTADSFDRQALLNLLAGANPSNGMNNVIQDQVISDEWKNTVNAWRTGINENDPSNGQNNFTLDPRLLPGQESQDPLQQMLNQQQQPNNQLNESSQQHQLNLLQAQRNRLPPLNTNTAIQGQGNDAGVGGVLKYEPGEFSPTSMAFYQSIGLYPHSASELPGTTSAPFYTTTFGDISGVPSSAGPSQQSFLVPNQAQGGLGARRRSFGGEGTNHPAAGAGTPGYGVEFTQNNNNSPFGQLRPGVVRGVSGHGHRRAAKSEDFGRVGTGWGVGAGGSTADFLQSITANDGSLLPPTNRGRAMSHSRNSSASSIRSASPALSISSQGSNWSNMERMELPDGTQVQESSPDPNTSTGQVPAATTSAKGRKRVAKLKVTSVATEVASTSRRTNSGVFKCPVPGCGSTFTRHFNLKGHLRSHNDERPYKCLYDGCPKAVVGFARQHDCKRHMLLHEGLRPFECEGCGKKFARLDALTRHHKSEQGQECALTHPLPVNPDGTPMSESQYKAYRGFKTVQPMDASPDQGRRRSSGVKSEFLSGDDRSGGEDELGGGLSGMEEYDRF
ncbi:uncharacterized protein IL334_003298 [Kwoniella shivajii]|uniref:C2H2-type domain-containing protein n=1 Tax=Kwoniella shivajii TaxID=564305 RepID=A0ABZ1CXQ6_9TREE|nr:hypothetical protein IL334_003298 [Kwoniella shivajii]